VTIKYREISTRSARNAFSELRTNVSDYTNRCPKAGRFYFLDKISKDREEYPIWSDGSLGLR